MFRYTQSAKRFGEADRLCLWRTVFNNEPTGVGAKRFPQNVVRE
jgi:hypothetical protein